VTKRKSTPRLTAKKIKVLKVEQIEPGKQRVELEIEAAPVPLPELVAFPVVLEQHELNEVVGEIKEGQEPLALPAEKRTLVTWLKSWWN
jgi:hypothetical protein